MVGRAVVRDGPTRGGRLTRLPVHSESIKKQKQEDSRQRPVILDERHAAVPGLRKSSNLEACRRWGGRHAGGEEARGSGGMQGVRRHGGLEACRQWEPRRGSPVYGSGK